MWEILTEILHPYAETKLRPASHDRIIFSKIRFFVDWAAWKWLRFKFWVGTIRQSYTNQHMVQS